MGQLHGPRPYRVRAQRSVPAGTPGIARGWATHAGAAEAAPEAGWCDQGAAEELAARRRHDWGFIAIGFCTLANPQAGAHLGWLPPSAAAGHAGDCAGIGRISVLSPPEVRQRTRPSDPPAYPRVPQCRSQDSHQKRMTLARAMHNVAQGRLTSFGAKAPVDGPTDAMKRWQATRSGLALRVLDGHGSRVGELRSCQSSSQCQSMGGWQSSLLW